MHYAKRIIYENNLDLLHTTESAKYTAIGRENHKKRMNCINKNYKWQVMKATSDETKKKRMYPNPFVTLLELIQLKLFCIILIAGSFLRFLRFFNVC